MSNKKSRSAKNKGGKGRSKAGKKYSFGFVKRIKISAVSVYAATKPI